MSTSPLQGATAAEEAELEAAAGRHEPVGGWRNPGAGFLALLGLAAIGANMAVLVSAILTLSLSRPPSTPLTRRRSSASPSASRACSHSSGTRCSAGSVTEPPHGWVELQAIPSCWARHHRGRCGGDAARLDDPCAHRRPGDHNPRRHGDHRRRHVGHPDQFAPGRRGAPSALVGLSAPLGALLGLFIAQAVAPNLTLMILLPAGIGAIGIVPFALVLKDHRLERADRPRFELGDFITTFWVSPIKHPNFAWAWWSRLLIFFGVAAVNAYQAFYLIIVQHMRPKVASSLPRHPRAGRVSR